MRIPDAAVPEIYVQPGESHLVAEPTILRTVKRLLFGCAVRDA